MFSFFGLLPLTLRGGSLFFWHGRISYMEKWERILKPENVIVGMRARRNLDAIRELATVFGEDAVPDGKRFIADIIQRERQASTGIGHGVAVPHAHDDSIARQLLAVGIAQEGIDFRSVDEQPVHIVALLATPKKHQKQHMDLLASLSRLLQHEDVRQSLIGAAEACEVVDIFTKNQKHI